MATNSNDAELLLFTNYKSVLHKSFVDMFRKEELTDATLTCDGKRVRVHKFLLSASSAYFNNVFKKHEGDCNISITNVAHDDLMKVLEYIYNGEAALQPSKVRAFMDAAKNFSITINDDEMQRVSGRLKSTHNQIANYVTQNKSDPAVAEIKNDCVGEKAASIGLERTETIHIKKQNSENERDRAQKKPNLENERDRAQKRANKSENSGIVVVSQAEFLERMFKLQNLPWPMDCDQATETVAQQSHVKSAEVIDKLSHSPPEQSTSNPQSIDQSKFTNANGIEYISENGFVDDKTLSNRKLKLQIRSMKKGIKKDRRKGTKDEDDIEEKQEKLIELKDQLATRREKKRPKKSKSKTLKRKQMQKQKEMQKIEQENGESTTAKRRRRHRRKTAKEKSEQCPPSSSTN